MTTPQNIGRYQVLESVGTGGFATVYRARDTQLGREVALKVLHPHMTGEAQVVERFLREARMAASLFKSGLTFQWLEGLGCCRGWI